MLTVHTDRTSELPSLIRHELIRIEQRLAAISEGSGGNQSSIEALSVEINDIGDSLSALQIALNAHSHASTAISHGEETISDTLNGLASSINTIQQALDAIEGHTHAPSEIILDEGTGDERSLVQELANLRSEIQEVVVDARNVTVGVDEKPLEEVLSGITGDVSANATDISSEATTRANADTSLQDSVTAEENARGAADTQLQQNINAEGVARSDADTALQDNVDAEVVARTDADTALQGNINAEGVARSDADGVLQGNIDAVGTSVTDETSARTAADGVLQANIDNSGHEDCNNITYGAGANEVDLKDKIAEIDAALNDLSGSW